MTEILACQSQPIDSDNGRLSRTATWRHPCWPGEQRMSTCLSSNKAWALRSLPLPTHEKKNTLWLLDDEYINARKRYDVAG